MPTRPDEPGDPFSLLQKQLILAQVQILELEDVRDELKTAIEQRAKVLNELQTVADRALADAQNAQAAESAAQQALTRALGERQQLQLTVESLRREIETMGRPLAGRQTVLAETGARTTQTGTPDELRELKSSRSWRWTAPLRAIERLFR